MHPGKRLLLGALAFACASVGTAARADATASNVVVSESTPSLADQAPIVRGTQVIWSAAETPLTGGTYLDLWRYDTATKQAARLLKTDSDSENLEDIVGSSVLFTRVGHSTPGDVLIYNLDTGSITPVAITSWDLPRSFQQPATNGSYVAYVAISQGGTGPLNELALYDLAGGHSVESITTSASALAKPRVAGNLVVYEDYRSGSADVQGFWLSSIQANGKKGAEPFSIAAGLLEESSPDTDGTRVIWVQPDDSGLSQLYVCDVAQAGCPRYAPSGIKPSPHKLQPRLLGNRIVWADDRTGDYDIYSYDFATNQETRLVGGARDQTLASVDGDKVAYLSNETGVPRANLFTLATAVPVVKPLGCDDAKTVPVVTLGTFTQPAMVSRFAGSVTLPPLAAGYNYYVCVENGSGGAPRIAKLTFAFDSTTSLLGNANFAPATDPPAWVAAQLPVSSAPVSGPPTHSWAVTLPYIGNLVSATVTVTIRATR